MSLRVLDLGVGMAAAIVGKLFVDIGASVVRMECSEGDPFYGVYPAYRVWHGGKRIETATIDRLDELLENSDVCLIGGETYPGLEWKHDAKTIFQRHRHLVVVELDGNTLELGLPGDIPDDLVAQARSGLAFEHYSDRPLKFSFPAPTYGAALQGFIAAMAALVERGSGRQGQIVSTSLLLGAMAWCGPLWLHTDSELASLRAIVPKDPRQLIFRCADGRFVQLALGTTGALSKLYAILKLTAADGAEGRGVPTGLEDPKNFFGDIDLLASRISTWGRDELVRELQRAELTIEPVLEPGACWDDAQVQHNGIIVRDADGTRHAGSPFRISPSQAQSGKGAIQPDPTIQGIRVVDLGSFIAGPYASVVLGDLGADVIKVEPLTGDPNRVLFSSFAPANRGKRSIAIDLKAPGGDRIMERLIVSADVVHHNFRRKVASRLGLDPETLANLNPRVVILETSGYGTSGPKAEQPGFDMVMQAFCGHERRAAGEAAAPLWYRPSIVDFGAGMLGAGSILFALRSRNQTGQGAVTSINLLDVGLFLMSELIQEADGQFKGVSETSAEQLGDHPSERFYRAQDGWIVVDARTDQMTDKLLHAMNLEKSITAPRSQWGAVESTVLAEFIGQRSAKEIISILQTEGVWAEQLRETARKDIMSSPAAKTAGYVIEDIGSQFGSLHHIGPMFRLSSSIGDRSKRGHVATLGEHTREILTELGFSDDEQDDFYSRKVVA